MTLFRLLLNLAGHVSRAEQRLLGQVAISPVSTVLDEPGVEKPGNNHLARVVVDLELISGFSHRDLVLQHHFDQLLACRVCNHGVLASILLLLSAPGLFLPLCGSICRLQLQFLRLNANLVSRDPPLFADFFHSAGRLGALLSVIVAPRAVVAVGRDRLVVIDGSGVQVWR